MSVEFEEDFTECFFCQDDFPLRTVVDPDGEGRTILGIFKRPSQPTDHIKIGGGSYLHQTAVEVAHPVLIVRSADLGAIDHGTNLVVADTRYRVVEIHDMGDAAGAGSTVMLSLMLVTG